MGNVLLRGTADTLLRNAGRAARTPDELHCQSCTSGSSSTRQQPSLLLAAHTNATAHTFPIGPAAGRAGTGAAGLGWGVPLNTGRFRNKHAGVLYLQLRKGPCQAGLQNPKTVNQSGQTLRLPHQHHPSFPRLGGSRLTKWASAPSPEC